MLCFNCYAFGHTKPRCQQTTPTCGHCAEKHTTADNTPCLAKNFCSRCESNLHSISSRNCPLYKKEDAIQRIRVNQGIAYPVAKKIFEAGSNNNSFARVANASKDKAIEVLEQKLLHVTKELADKDRKTGALEEKLNSRPVGNAVDSQAFAEFRQAITELRVQLQRKDEQIKNLEKKLASKDDIITLTKKYGTITDLTSQVKQLKKAMASKDNVIASLRADQYMNPSSTPYEQIASSNTTDYKSSGTKEKSVTKNTMKTKMRKGIDSPIIFSDPEITPDPNGNHLLETIENSDLAISSCDETMGSN